jgi:fucose permease
MNPPLTLWQRVVRASGSQAGSLTLSYYFVFIALGLTASSLGPTLLGLANQTGSALSQVSFLFAARAFGYLAGSFIGGRLYDRFNGHRTMAAGLLILAVLLATVPTLSLLWLLTIVLLAVGFMEGMVDVGGNALIVWLHRDKVGPYMNGLHLFFAIGAFLTPILIAQVILLTGSIGPGYWLLALLVLPTGLRLLRLPSPPPIVTSRSHGAVHVSPYFLGLFVVFFLLLTGAESAFGGWVFTYGVRAGLANDTTAAYVNAAYWGMFAFGRLISIPISTRVRPRIIMVSSLLISLVGVSLLLLLPSSPAALWVGAMLFGLGVAPGFPTMLTFAGRHMTITGAITGWFFVGASAGAMSIPWLIGQTFEPLGPPSAIWIITAAMVLDLAVFGLILLYARRHERAKTNP